MKMRRSFVYVPLALLGVSSLVLGACSSASKSASGTVSVEAEGEAPEETVASDATFNDGDVSFAQGMIPHHRQAVEMAIIALDPARKAGQKVKDLATQIQNAQGPEIELMTGWLTDWKKPVDAMAGMDHEGMDMAEMAEMQGMAGMEGMMSAEEMKGLEAATANEFDTSWLDMMVRHHEGAVTMSKTVLTDGKAPAVKELAGKIISAQEAEIAEMTQLVTP